MRDSVRLVENRWGATLREGQLAEGKSDEIVQLEDGNDGKKATTRTR